MTLPEGLEEGLLKSLRIHAFLKEKFRKRFDAIPDSVKGNLTYEKMQKLYKGPSEVIFLSSMAELGFKKDKKYLWHEKSEVSIKEQAEDYMNFLYDFDNTLHDTLTALLKTPKDQTAYSNYMKQYKKWPKPKKDYNNSIKALYKYIHYLSE